MNWILELSTWEDKIDAPKQGVTICDVWNIAID